MRNITIPITMPRQFIAKSRISAPRVGINAWADSKHTAQPKSASTICPDGLLKMTEHASETTANTQTCPTNPSSRWMAIPNGIGVGARKIQHMATSRPVKRNQRRYEIFDITLLYTVYGIHGNQALVIIKADCGEAPGVISAGVHADPSVGNHRVICIIMTVNHAQVRISVPL